MEKRVAGIVRWLERCIKSYKSGAVESALMDAECARADMEVLKSELWNKLEVRARTRTSWRRFGFFGSLKAAEAFFAALVITLITAAPLALSQERAAEEVRAEGHFSLEWVTPDELELLGNLRKRPDERTAMAVNAAVRREEPAEQPKPAPRAETPAKRRVQEPQPQQNERRKPESGHSESKLSESGFSEARLSDSRLSYDRILSLIAVGEQAMKNEEPAIKVENTSGR